jgi:hypothetical protein
MTTPQIDVAVEMLKDLQEFGRSGSKEAFRKQLCEEFVRRLGPASPHEALAMIMTSLFPLLRQRLDPGWENHIASRIESHQALDGD